MKTPRQIAVDIVNRFPWTTNMVHEGRLVGQQCLVAMEIADAITREREEIDRLRALLHKVQCDELDRATNKRLSAVGHRRRSMVTRNAILAAQS